MRRSPGQWRVAMPVRWRRICGSCGPRPRTSSRRTLRWPGRPRSEPWRRVGWRRPAPRLCWTHCLTRSEPGMKVVHTRAELAAARSELGEGAAAVVMTLGALHEGHATLIRRARERAAQVVVTIFLNPLQFGRGEDL